MILNRIQTDFTYYQKKLQWKSHAYSTPAMVVAGNKFFSKIGLGVGEVKLFQVHYHSCICLVSNPCYVTARNGIGTFSIK